MAEKGLVCPVDLKWAKKIVRLYPEGWSEKIDSLRGCIEKAEKAKEAEEEGKE